MKTEAERFQEYVVLVKQARDKRDERLQRVTAPVYEAYDIRIRRLAKRYGVDPSNALGR